MKPVMFWIAAGWVCLLPMAPSAWAQYPQGFYPAPESPGYPMQVPYAAVPSPVAMQPQAMQPLQVPPGQLRCDCWNELMRAYGVCWGQGYHAPVPQSVSMAHMHGPAIPYGHPGYGGSILHDHVDLPPEYFPRPHDLEPETRLIAPSNDAPDAPGASTAPTADAPSRLTSPGDTKKSPEKPSATSPDKGKSDREELPLGPESEPESPSDSASDLLLNGNVPGRAVTIQPARRTIEMRSAKRRIEEPRSPFSKVRR